MFKFLIIAFLSQAFCLHMKGKNKYKYTNILKKK